MELEEEARLVAWLLSGDARALDQFVFAYRRFIISIWSRQTDFCPEDVKELYQRFLLHIWEDNYRRLRPWKGTRSLRAYLGAVARNLARDYRRERRHIPDDVARWQLGVEQTHEADVELDRRSTLQRALGKLSDRDRDLIHRRYYLDESYREIAQARGMTVNHVGVALLRAESHLRTILQKTPIDL